MNNRETHVSNDNGQLNTKCEMSFLKFWAE